MIETRVGLPQTNAFGLSESWLFQHCGERHWARFFEAIGVDGITSPRLLDRDGDRLYPTFIAVRGRYDEPLRSVRLDDTLYAEIDSAHYGRAFFCSTVTLRRGTTRYVLELVTTLVARSDAGGNRLRHTPPAEPFTYGSRALDAPPPLIRLVQDVRHGKLENDELMPEDRNAPAIQGAVDTVYEPSPFIDFNGAGLLYFAAYPVIADTVESRLLARTPLAPLAERWPGRASTVARDVLYHGNLGPGQRLTARLERLVREGDRWNSHIAFFREDDGSRLADLFTVKQDVAGATSQVTPQEVRASVQSPT